MASPFAALDDRLSRSIGRVFGEAAIVRPRLHTDYTGYSVDPDRAPKMIDVIFSAGPEQTRLGGGGKGDLAGQSKLQMQTASMWVPAAEIAAIPYVIRQGDAVTFEARPGRSSASPRRWRPTSATSSSS